METFFLEASRLACRLGNKLCEHATEEALRHNGEAQEQKFVIEEYDAEIEKMAISEPNERKHRKRKWAMRRSEIMAYTGVQN